MANELLAFESKRTWNLIPLPSSSSVYWKQMGLFRQSKTDGTLDQYIARLVTDGHKQEYGID